MLTSDKMENNEQILSNKNSNKDKDDLINKNPFNVLTTYTKEDIERLKKDTSSQKSSEKYRKELLCKRFKFPIEDFIDFKVKAYTKPTIKIKTYCNYKEGSIPKALIIMFHGLGNHSARNSHVAQHFADEGFFVAAMDFREHGLTEYDLTYIPNFKDNVEDAKKFITLTEEFTLKTFKQKFPKFLMGSSMGAMVLNYVSKEVEAEGIIYNTPYFGVSRNWCERGIMSCLAYMLPSCSMNVKKIFRLNINSKNPNMLDDPCPIVTERCPRFGTVNTVLKQSLIFAKEKNTSHEKCMLIISAGVEKVVSLDSIIKYYETSEVKDKSILIYPNMWHASLAEEEVVDILLRISNWIIQRLK